MKHNKNIFPRKLNKDEIILAPSSWIKTLPDYSKYRAKALKEAEYGFYTFITNILIAVVKKDKKLIDLALEETKNNDRRDSYLNLAGSALFDLGFVEDGLSMLREAIELRHSPATLLSLAASTNDLDEKENLAEKALSDNPKDIDALRHLAYAKYFKGERKKAEDIIDEILANDPKNFYALEFKGNIYLDKGNYKKALSQYLKIKLKPMHISLQFKICHCYHLLNISNKAKKIAKKIKGKLSMSSDHEIDVEFAENVITEILNS